jgi:arabinofuranosyltransferase
MDGSNTERAAGVGRVARPPDGTAVAALLAILCVAFGILVLRTAWLNDDAFITLRTIDNFVHGFGLRWNVVERVQAYTHPLWMLLLAGPYALTREPYFTTVGVSVAVSMAGFLVLVFGVARARPVALLVGLALMCSRSFVEFSTSGLENPLTHLLLATFLVVLYSTAERRPRTLRLALVLSLVMLTRLDIALLVGPVFLVAVWKQRPVAWRALALGASPLVAWEAFSLAYYGFLVPNTAYAKLHTGIPWPELVAQGCRYLLDFAEFDPVSFVLIGVGLVVGLTSRTWRGRALATGILLSLAYTIRVGGDFMSGRFLTPVVTTAVGLLANRPWPRLRRRWLAVAAPILVLGMTSSLPAWRADVTAGPPQSAHLAIKASGIADERRFYSRWTALFRQTREENITAHVFLADARDRQRAEGFPPVFVEGAVGMVGYYFGPGVHIIDMFGLADPLVARLPAMPRWRIGHFTRTLPEGYAGAVLTSAPLGDDNLNRYYAQLRTVTRAPLWSLRRWRSIVAFNLGRLDPLVADVGYVHVAARQIDRAGEDGAPWDGPGTVLLPEGLLDVSFDGPTSGRVLDVSVSGNDFYAVEFLRGGAVVGRHQLEPTPGAPGSLIHSVFAVPAAASPFDGLRVIGRRGDYRYSVGHLRVLQ